MILSYSHHGRVHREAAFSQLAGAAPIEASPGKTVRHRLNRGGDRQLNRALHTIAVTRMNYDPRTRTYVARRRAEGKTDREIRRCLKRYLARHFHRKLRSSPLPTALQTIEASNGVRERGCGSLKYERLYREDIADGQSLAEHAETYRHMFNTVRPHEAIDWQRPAERYLATPKPHPTTPKIQPDDLEQPS